MKGVAIVALIAVAFCLIELYLRSRQSLRQQILSAMREMGGSGTMSDIRREVLAQRLGRADPFDVSWEMYELEHEGLINVRWPKDGEPARKPPALIYELK